MNANEIAAYIKDLEKENLKLQSSVKNLLKELEESANNPQDNELIADMNRLVDLVAYSIEWQEEHLKTLPKGKQGWARELVEAYRKIRPKEG